MDNIKQTKQYKQINSLIKAFVKGTRTNGDTYYYLDDSKKKDWMNNCIHECHKEYLPIDCVYEDVYEIAYTIREYIENNTITDRHGFETGFTDYVYEIADRHTEIYNNELYKWAANNYSVGFIDEILEEKLEFSSYSDLLIKANYQYKLFITETIVSYLYFDEE